MKKVVLSLVISLLIFGGLAIAAEEVKVPLDAVKSSCYGQIDMTKAEFSLLEIGKKCVKDSWLEENLSQNNEKAESEQKELITYNATITEGSDQIQVQIKLQNVDAEQNYIRFNLPELPDYSQDHDQFDFYDFLGDVQAYTENKDLEVVKEEDFIKIGYDSKLTYFEYSIDKQIYNIDPFLPDQLFPVVYFNDDYGYFWSAFLFLTPDGLKEPSSLHVAFDTPASWKVLAPFKKVDNYYAVEANDVISLYRQLNDSAFYMGEIEFHVEKTSNDTTHHLARLEADENEWGLTTYREAEEYMNKVAKIYNYFVDYFGHNPYHDVLWRPDIKDFKNGTQISPGFGYMGNGWHYWPEGREFEITCHVVQSWISGAPSRPLTVSKGIEKGFGEYYLGYKSAYELFENDVDLAKLYYTYLVYDRMHGEQVQNHSEYEFMKGFALGIYLDNKIQETSNGKYELKDVLRHVYDQYHLTEHMVTYPDIQEAISELTGNDLETIFNDYVYGDKKIPAYQYVSDYKSYFNQMSEVLDDTFHTNSNGFVIPFFINIEMTLQNDQHIMSGMFFPNYMSEFADYIKENHNISDLSKSDVESALTELTGKDCSGFFTYWEDSYGKIELEAMKDWLSDFKNNGEAKP